MMRRRVRWAVYVVHGVSALWLAVVLLYSVGRDRELKRLARRVEALEQRPVSVAASEGPSPVAQDAAEPVPAPVPPRLRCTGRSGPFRWSEWVFPDGESRRYYLATNATPARVAAYLEQIQTDALEHQVFHVEQID